MRTQALILTFVSIAILVFVVSALQMDFYQDDAFISYRYVANYLDGHGLVFNEGERVEGYTNFGWVLFLLLWCVLGLGYMAVSKLFGIFLAAAAIFVAYLFGYQEFRERGIWFAVVPAGLVGFNLSLAYWAQAGLETAAFVFLTAL